MDDTSICQNDAGKNGLKEMEQDKKQKTRGRKKSVCSPRHIICPDGAVKWCRDNELPVAAKLYAGDARTVFMKCHKAEPRTSIP
jgi:hypothetical protein